MSGEFTNAPAGSRITTLNGLGSFAVLYEPNAVKLTGFQVNSPAAQLLNISTRGYLKAGNDIFGNRYLIGGFIITGTEAKTIAVRGIGPSLLQFNIAPVAPDPVISLHRSDQSVAASNDNWKSTQREEIEALGLEPQDDREAALVVTLDPGAYTVVLEEKTGTTGTALIEIYDLSPDGAKLGNLSTRGFVTPNDPLIGGIITGGEGPASAEVVVRAIGPRLGRSGDYTSMADPTLELRDRNGDLLAFNDDHGENWDQFTGSASELRPFDPKESAVLVSLPPGQYTAVLRGKDGGSGTALVEFYDLRR